MYRVRKREKGKWIVEKTDQERPKPYKKYRKAKNRQEIGTIEKEKIRVPEDILPFILDDIGIKDPKLRKVLTVLALQDWRLQR